MRDHIVLDVFRSQVSLECGSYGHDGPPVQHASLASVQAPMPAVIKAETKATRPSAAIGVVAAGTSDITSIQPWAYRSPTRIPKSRMTAKRIMGSATATARPKAAIVAVCGKLVTFP
jgi:hypothetical protein